jgi:hypothetical protein
MATFLLCYGVAVAAAFFFNRAFWNAVDPQGGAL